MCLESPASGSVRVTLTAPAKVPQPRRSRHVRRRRPAIRPHRSRASSAALSPQGAPWPVSAIGASIVSRTSSDLRFRSTSLVAERATSRGPSLPVIYGFETHGVVNRYLIEDGDRLTAVDARLSSSWDEFTDWIKARKRRISDLEAVVLTHAHVDHFGFAGRARKEAGARIYAHHERRRSSATRGTR